MDFYEPYIRAIKGTSSNPRITFEVNARPREEVQRYKDAGADHIHFNMEVWDKKLFPWINPGKSERVGWDNWVRWMEDAVEVFGNGMVQPSFVSGVEMARPHGFKTVEEAVKSTTSGFEYLMARGIFPRPQQWRREPSTALCKEAEQPPVPISSSSIGLGPGVLPSGPKAVPSTTLWPLPDSPRKVRSSTHFTRAFTGFFPASASR